MGKIDEVKETLNSLRAYFGVSVLIIITVGGNIVKSYREEVYDLFFYSGMFVIVLLSIFMVVLIKKIKIKTKEIGKL